jgi:hypothetical protein
MPQKLKIQCKSLEFKGKVAKAKTMRNHRGAMENTMRSNEAIIALWTSGCNGAADLAALSAWLARAGARQNTKSAQRAHRKAQSNNSHLCH